MMKCRYKYISLKIETNLRCHLFGAGLCKPSEGDVGEKGVIK